jgi:hypothetical protein
MGIFLRTAIIQPISIILYRIKTLSPLTTRIPNGLDISNPSFLCLLPARLMTRCMRHHSLGTPTFLYGLFRSLFWALGNSEGRVIDVFGPYHRRLLPHEVIFILFAINIAMSTSIYLLSTKLVSKIREWILDV